MQPAVAVPQTGPHQIVQQQEQQTGPVLPH